MDTQLFEKNDFFAKPKFLYESIQKGTEIGMYNYESLCWLINVFSIRRIVHLDDYEFASWYLNTKHRSWLSWFGLSWLMTVLTSTTRHLIPEILDNEPQNLNQ